MYSKELLKGTIEIIILKLLQENEELYGYDITQRVKELTNGRIDISEGSLYPILHRLEASGKVTVRKEAIGKRYRKYYSITKDGRLLASSKIKELEQFILSLNLIFNLKPA